MSRLTLLVTLMLSSIALNGQNINATFTGTGAATQIDSITATNLKTNQSVTLPGNETLILTVNTGIPSVSELTNIGVVFPNPFSGRATFSMIIPKVQTVYLQVQNLVGQVVAETKALVQPGENEFALTVNMAGIYMVSLTSELGITSYKIICTEATEPDNRIQFNCLVPGFYRNPSDLKSSQTGYSLGYAIGDIILYRCKSGIYTTIVTDSPAFSKIYNIGFAACDDPDGKNYSIIKIGDQIWMGENLAYLPSVSSSSTGSNTIPYYYVYDYEGTNVVSAKAVSNYSTYGALYNWEAAKTACPSGWHLPTDPEWTTLTDYLTNNGYGYGGSGSDIGKSMASSSGWTPYSSTGTIGNDQGSNNRSGFTALPGASRSGSGGFYGLGCGAYFWSSSEYGSGAWGRDLHYNFDGVYRSYCNRGNGFSVRCLQN